MNDLKPFKTLSDGDFDLQDTETKFVTARLIRMLVLATNKHKLQYPTLRYIYRQAMIRSKMVVPRKAKKLYQLPTSDELDNFFNAIEDPQIKLLFLVIHNTGLRVTEACQIKVEKIDFQNNTIFITGKGAKDRLVPITDKLIEKISLFLSGRKHIYLFESRLGTPYTARRVEQICQELKVKAGITKKFTPHTLRHLFFSKLAEFGLDIDVRAMIAGHTNSRTQEVYTHVGLAGTKNLILEILEKMEQQKVLK